MATTLKMNEADMYAALEGGDFRFGISVQNPYGAMASMFELDAHLRAVQHAANLNHTAKTGSVHIKGADLEGEKKPSPVVHAQNHPARNLHHKLDA